jgi:glycosyltransferase involved in cell wall biosynthesis
MKVVFVLRSNAIHGGVERVIADKMNFLAEQGHEVTLVTYEQGIHPNIYQLNHKVQTIDLDCRFFTLYRYSLPVRLFYMWLMHRRFKRRFHSLVKKLQPDIIVAVANATDFLRQVVTAPQGKKVMEAHIAYLPIITSDDFLKRCRIASFRRAVRMSDAVIALTDSDKRYWEKEVKKVLVVPNPIHFYCEQIDGFERKEGRILCVGRLEQQKRIDRLIDAFACIADRYPQWYIDVYGEGTLYNDLKRQIISLGLEERIHLNPPTHQIKQEYQSSQFSVLSSDYEGFGLVIAESMACGTPVVSTDCMFGPSDIIEDKVDGLLCKLDVDDLASKMEWMITHECERKEMGIRAHQSVARYRKENMMKEWENTYLSLIE